MLTNKYAEGYPGRRYYGGCEVVDVAEELAIARAKELFGAEHANVQPHSGSQANMAVYFTLLKPGDTMLGPNLAHGGHLTAGSPMNFSGKLYKIVPVRRPQGHRAHRPRPGARPRPRAPPEADHRRRVGLSARHRLRALPARSRDEVGAALMADIAHPAGLVAAGLHPSPVPYADFVTTTTHKTLRGPRGGMIMCRAAHAKDARQGRAARHPGRSAHARDRGQGGGLPRGADAGVAGLPAADRQERGGPRRGPAGAAASGWCPAAPTPT